jgi:putative endonuclease
VLYVGSTNDLERRVFEHKHGLIDGFTKKHRVTRLVHFEEFEGPAAMVRRERQLKGRTRRRKLALIHTQNPEMVDYARRTARAPSPRPGGSFAFGSGWPQRPPRLRMPKGAAVCKIQRTYNSEH